MKQTKQFKNQTTCKVNQLEPLWTCVELSRFLNVSQSKIRHDVMDRKIPFKKIGTLVRFDPVEIFAWLEKCNHGKRGKK